MRYPRGWGRKTKERKGKKEGDFIKEKSSTLACRECVRVLLPTGAGISNRDC